MTISPFLVAGAIGLAVAYLLTPFIAWLATRLGVLAQPGGRHIHRAPIPRLKRRFYGVGVAIDDLEVRQAPKIEHLRPRCASVFAVSMPQFPALPTALR